MKQNYGPITIVLPIIIMMMIMIIGNYGHYQQY